MLNINKKNTRKILRSLTAFYREGEIIHGLLNFNPLLNLIGAFV